MDEGFERFARLGYAARGTVYVVVGGLAVLAGRSAPFWLNPSDTLFLPLFPSA
jgi:hypothetical protein